MLVEAITYRFRGHSMADPEEYRTKEQVAEWRKKDPIEVFARKLEEEGILEEGEADKLDEAIVKIVDECRPLRRQVEVPAARVALRRHLRARRPGQGLVLRRRALRRRARGREGARARQGGARPDRRLRRRGRAGLARGPRARQASDERTPTTTTPRRRRRTDGRRPLPRGAQPGAARGDAARRERLPHGRGHRRLQRRVQGDQRAARGVRREARARHADLGEHDRRHGRRLRDDRACAPSSS